VSTALRTWGRLDIVFHCAGIIRVAPIWEMPPDAWDDVINVHLRGAYVISRYASAVMRDQRYGRLIYVSSGASAGGLGSHYQVNYAAAKAGIHGLMLGVALALRGDNVTANAIFPRAYTRMNDTPPVRAAAIARGDEQSYAAKGPIDAGDRDPANVAPVCVYLASAESGWISGRTFMAAGREITLMTRQQKQHTLQAEGAWDIDALFPRMKPEFGAFIDDLPVATQEQMVTILEETPAPVMDVR
jgi:NAD(P)-dependent dehydrogenase (short-subunit alcohol dehydrogenase family)